MDEKKLGITNMVLVLDKLASIIEDGVLYFKDGVQITDVAFVPKAIGYILMIAKALPNAIKESKDLELEEIGELTGVLVNRILAAFKKK